MPKHILIWNLKEFLNRGWHSLIGYLCIHLNSLITSNNWYGESYRLRGIILIAYRSKNSSSIKFRNISIHLDAIYIHLFFLQNVDLFLLYFGFAMKLTNLLINFDFDYDLSWYLDLPLITLSKTVIIFKIFRLLFININFSDTRHWHSFFFRKSLRNFLRLF